MLLSDYAISIRQIPFNFDFFLRKGVFKENKEFL